MLLVAYESSAITRYNRSVVITEMIRNPLSIFILTFLASCTGRWSTVPPPRTGARLRSSAQPTAGAWWPVRPGGHRIPHTRPANRALRFSRTRKDPAKYPPELRSARAGYMAGSAEAEVASEAGKHFDKRFVKEKKKRSGVRALQGNGLFKKLLLCALRSASPVGARASS